MDHAPRVVERVEDGLRARGEVHPEPVEGGAVVVGAAELGLGHQGHLTSAVPSRKGVGAGLGMISVSVGMGMGWSISPCVAIATGGASRAGSTTT